MQLTPKPELDSRIQQLQAQLTAADLEGALIVQRADLFYFSGTVQRSLLFVPAAGTPLLMTRKSLARARCESQLESILPLEKTRQLPELLTAHNPLGGRIRRLGMELDVMPVNTFRYYQRVLEGVDLVDCSTSIRQIRAVKSAYELALMRRAARGSQAIYRAVPELFREGITEVELSGLLEAIARRKGHQGMIPMRRWNDEVYYGHLMAGDNAAIPSFMAAPTGGSGVNPATAQGPGTRPIQAGEPLLVDILFAPDGYMVDQTRIYAIGSLPDELVHAHQAMLEVQAVVAEAARPGVTGEQLWNLAVETAAGWGVGDHFMGHGSDRVSFVGHGVGIELDELPVLAPRQTAPLEAGMVIALEPKAIFPGLGVVGVENTHVVTSAGLERLTTLSDDIFFV